MESKFLSIILRNNSIQIYENKPINYSSNDDLALT